MYNTIQASTYLYIRIVSESGAKRCKPRRQTDDICQARLLINLHLALCDTSTSCDMLHAMSLLAAVLYFIALSANSHGLKRSSNGAQTEHGRPPLSAVRTT